MSVSNITDNGYKVIFDKYRATVKRRDGSTALTATKRDLLYIVDEGNNHAMITDNTDNDKMTRWHQRYGHLNVSDLKNLKSKEMVKGIDFTVKSDKIKCEICDLNKISTQPFKLSKSREKEVLNLIHSDICGPMNVESLGGAKYFVTFIDDFSRYTETVMLKKRSEVLQAFRNYKRRVEKQTGRRIKKLRTDNGKEYLSTDFNKFLEDEGIARQLTVEYTPQQNGIAERANRTIVEMARCMIQQAKLPQSLWAEAVNMATFIRNRCPTKCLNNKTPYEAWTNEKPYVGFFRIFGSKVIALDKSHKQGKFLQKGNKYVLVGYSQEAKAYRLWKPGTKTIVKSRDVKFYEKTYSNNEWDDKIRMPNNSNSLEENNEPIVKLPLLINNNSEDEDYQPLEDEDSQQFEEVIQQSENEETENMPRTSEENKNTQHGRGRPKLLKTGKPGRPTKIYQQRKNINHNPINVTEAMDREDHTE